MLIFTGEWTYSVAKSWPTSSSQYTSLFPFELANELLETDIDTFYFRISQGAKEIKPLVLKASSHGTRCELQRARRATTILSILEPHKRSANALFKRKVSCKMSMRPALPDDSRTATRCRGANQRND